MAFKLKTMFEAKMKALLGDSITIKQEEADEANDSIGEDYPLRETGDMSQGKPSVGDKAPSGKQTTVNATE